MYKVFETSTFKKKLKHLSKDFIHWVDKIETKLQNDPYVGDPIRGRKWLREKKHKKFRVYYLIYEKYKPVLMVDISGKKDQSRVINAIWSLRKDYKIRPFTLLWLLFHA